MSLKELYEQNKDFKHFVDGHIHSKDGKITVEQAFEHKIVKIYADLLLKRQS